MSIHTKIIYFSLLAILLVPKIDASQASSTSSASSASAQSQTSALLESLFASLRRDITREFGLTNNTASTNTIAQKAKERSPLEKIEETIKLANEYKQQGNRTLAITFMKHAYDHSFDFPFYHAQAAGNLGMMFFEQGKHAQALTYLEEAYTLSKKLSHTDNIVSTCLAVFLGRIYLLDRGVKPNYAKAFAFLTEAQKSADGGLSAFAKNFIGLIYLQGLGKRQNTLEARSYLLEALKGSKTPEASDYVLTSLLVTLSKQLKELDTLFTSIIEQQKRSSEQIARMLKQAYADLEEIKTTQKVFPFYLAAIFSRKIAEKEKQLNQLQSQIEQAQKQKSSNQESAQITASANVQTGSKTLEVQTTQATMQSMLKEAIERYEAFLKKPTDARYQEAVYALREVLLVALDDTKMRTDIMQMLDRTIEIYKQQRETAHSITATNNTQEKKEDSQNWSLLDPFHQITNKLSATVQQRLNLLQTDYLEVPNVIKLHGFINLWRTRVGNIRIIYTVLPESHAIGIVQIDDRKDVYENVEELEHREAWFHAPNLEARLQESANKKA